MTVATMKALTVCQPYAELLARGVKPIENRPWSTIHRGSLVIHAGKSRDWLDDGDDARYPGLAFGAIVAVVTLYDCVRVEDLPTDLSANEHANGPWCWLVRDPIRLHPRQARGAQGLWAIDRALVEAAYLGVACAGGRPRPAHAGTGGAMTDETRQRLRVFPYRPGLGMGNIIWAERNGGSVYYRVSQFAMRAGRFPQTHPVAPGDAKSNDRAEMGASDALAAFRARGYWASCFPEGDGITWKPEREQSDAQCLADIRECFDWPWIWWETP